MRGAGMTCQRGIRLGFHWRPDSFGQRRRALRRQANLRMLLGRDAGASRGWDALLAGAGAIGERRRIPIGTHYCRWQARRTPIARTVMRLLPLLALLSAPAFADPIGTAFTYQGELKAGASVATGLYDFQVCLFESEATLVPLACAPDFDSTPVENGRFTIQLDFGAAVFTGEKRFLEIRVRPDLGVPAFTRLLPRHPIRPAPEATRAASSPWTGLSGVPSDFADGTDDIGAGTVTSVTAGSGLTGGTITTSGSLAVDTSAIQSRVTGTCPSGQYVRAINPNGTVLCEAVIPPPPPPPTIANNVSSMLSGRVSSMALGGAGLPQLGNRGVCASHDQIVVSCGNASCTNAQYASTCESASEPIARGALVVPADGIAVVGYTLAGLSASRCATIACSSLSTRTVLDNSSPFAGLGVAGGIGGDGRVLFAFVGKPDGALRTAKCVDAACSSATIVIHSASVLTGPGGGVAMATSIAHLPAIAYTAMGAGGASGARLIRCIDPNCATPVLSGALYDSGINTGRDPSVVVPPDGRPIVSHYDVQNFDLLVTRCGNADCTSGNATRVMDSGGAVGRGSSIALVAGLPTVSYFDSSNARVKVLRCGTLDCDTGNTFAVIYQGVSLGAYTSIIEDADSRPNVAFEVSGSTVFVRCANFGCN